jgi:hypothetical protein
MAGESSSRIWKQGALCRKINSSPDPTLPKRILVYDRALSVIRASSIVKNVEALPALILVKFPLFPGSVNGPMLSKIFRLDRLCFKEPSLT